MLQSDLRGIALLRAAHATGSGVEPVHVSGHVIPEGDNQSHATLDSFPELFHATLVLEVWSFAMGSKRFLAEVLSHGIARTKAILGLLDLLAILVIILVHALKVAILIPSELCHDSERLLGVDGVIRTRAVKLLVTEHVWIHVTTVAIGWAEITLAFLLGAAFLLQIADFLGLFTFHGVQGQLHGHFVG